MQELPVHNLTMSQFLDLVRSRGLNDIMMREDIIALGITAVSQPYDFWMEDLQDYWCK